jgi:hypothetical protein
MSAADMAALMGGMSMSDGGMFQSDNMALARDYWLLIAGVMGMLLIVRLTNYWQNWLR